MDGEGFYSKQTFGLCQVCKKRCVSLEAVKTISLARGLR